MAHRLSWLIGRLTRRLARNEKLTPIIAGRTIATATQDGAALTVTFADGWVMKIKTGDPAPSPEGLAGRTVKSVLQGGVEMDLVFADNSSAAIRLAEETSSVMVRDQDGGFQYAD